MSLKCIDIMDATYATGFETLLESPPLLKDYISAIEFAKDIGIDHFEINSPNLFLSQILKLNENPFLNFKKIRKVVGEEVNLQVYTNCLNTFARTPVSYEILELFAKLLSKYDITTVRSYDALNDEHNLDDIAYVVTDKNILHEITIVLQNTPTDLSNFLTVKFYKEKINAILDLGITFESICFLDKAGVTNPTLIYDIIKMTRELLGVDMHIRVSISDRVSLGVSSYMAALEAGVDGLDLAVSPFSGGASLPDMLTVVKTAKKMGYYFGDIQVFKIYEYQNFLKDNLKKYKFIETLKNCDSNAFFVPIEPKALYNFSYDLNNQLYKKVIEELTNVIEKGGYSAFIDPIAKYYLEQSYLNVKHGKWKKFAKGFAETVLGYYGKTPIVSDPQIIDMVRDDLKLPISIKTPINIANEDMKKSIDYAKRILISGDIEVTDENIYIRSVME